MYNTYDRLGELFHSGSPGQGQATLSDLTLSPGSAVTRCSHSLINHHIRILLQLITREYFFIPQVVLYIQKAKTLPVKLSLSTLRSTISTALKYGKHLAFIFALV